MSFNISHSAFPEVFTTYTSILADSKLGLHLKVSSKGGKKGIYVILSTITNLKSK